jgi:hypothetical protein
MSANNVTPITAAGKLKEETAERIEELRARIFRAMNLVETTRLSLSQDHELDRRGTLEGAYEILDEVASELNTIS